MPIGTEQHTKEEIGGIPRHFLCFLPIQATYTAGKFAKEALQTLYNLLVYQDVVKLIGGSGFYIKAICEGLAGFPTIHLTYV
jgi:tRNA dimethylallyltransferase